MLKKDDIILIKSYGNEKTKIFLRGVNEVLGVWRSTERFHTLRTFCPINQNIVDSEKCA